MGRYLGKNFCLGLCYGAFVKPVTFRGAFLAARAAFLSCAYDVATDWRSFSKGCLASLEGQLRCLVPDWAVELTMNLYRAEMREELGIDGLERGVIAVEFITGLIGPAPIFSAFGIRRLGLLLQIVDDIRDFEHDVAFDDVNCLATQRAGLYISFFRENLGDLIFLFRRDLVMRSVILQAKKKVDLVIDLT